MRFCGLVLALCLGMHCAVAEEAVVCPDPMTGKVRAGAYDFEFQSWSSAAQQGYLFSNCVRNTSAQVPLFIAWAGLTGFVKEHGGVSYVSIPSEADRQKKLRTPLWYGAGPQKVEVETLFPDEQSLLQQGRGSVSIVRKVADDAERRGVRSLSPITTTAAVYVPVANYAAGTTLEDIVRDVDGRPGILRRFSMQFTTRAVSDPHSGRIVSFVDECAYRFQAMRQVLNASGGIAIRFADADLQRGMFGSDAPHNMNEDWRRRTSDKTLTIKGSRPGSDLTTKQIAERQTTMQLVSLGGAVLASVPLTFYAGGAPP